MAQRNLFCVVLGAYRIWNVAYADVHLRGGDCVLKDDDYDEVGVFGADLTFNGTSATFGEADGGGAIADSHKFAFESTLTPIIERIKPAWGTPGTIVTVVGSGFDAAFAPTDTWW